MLLNWQQQATDILLKKKKSNFRLTIIQILSVSLRLNIVSAHFRIYKYEKYRVSVHR